MASRRHPREQDADAKQDQSELQFACFFVFADLRSHRISSTEQTCKHVVDEQKSQPDRFGDQHQDFANIDRSVVSQHHQTQSIWLVGRVLSSFESLGQVRSVKGMESVLSVPALARITYRGPTRSRRARQKQANSVRLNLALTVRCYKERDSSLIADSHFPLRESSRTAIKVISLTDGGFVQPPDGGYVDDRTTAFIDAMSCCSCGNSGQLVARR